MISPTLPLNENLESIRKALEATTPEKWVYENKSVVCEKHLGLIADCFDNEDVKAETNATWIAASKDVCEYLLKVVEAQRETILRCANDRASAERALDSGIQQRLEGTKP